MIIINTGVVCSLPCPDWEAQGWVPEQVCRAEKGNIGKEGGGGRDSQGNGNSRSEREMHAEEGRGASIDKKTERQT